MLGSRFMTARHANGDVIDRVSLRVARLQESGPIMLYQVSGPLSRIATSRRHHQKEDSADRHPAGGDIV